MEEAADLNDQLLLIIESQVSLTTYYLLLTTYYLLLTTYYLLLTTY